MRNKRFAVSVCGHFAFGLNKLNGQTIKTKIITEEIEKHFGEKAVKKIDTCGGLKALCRLPFQLAKALYECDNLIILPAYKGVRIITFILMLLRFIYKGCTVHYIVIGGWLPKYAQSKFLLKYCIKKSVDYIYCETTTMQKSLQHIGLSHISVMPNCKTLEIISEKDLSTTAEAPYKLCIFSRIMKNKGVEIAVNAVRNINEKAGRNIYILDIYGPIWEAEKEWFEHLQQTFPQYVQYKGAVPFNDSVQVLKGYFALLFPTLFYTEGVPGTIIDAYAAGLPVISSRWESFQDVIDESVTDYGYQFDKPDALKDILTDISYAPDKIISLKSNCLRKALSFVPETVIKVLLKNINTKKL
ncbi:MAG: glycosyltransferase [Prevotellaceae bacterium]|nr:glycosyltransferase [Prevotellaceae bacterium]